MYVYNSYDFHFNSFGELNFSFDFFSSFFLEKFERDIIEAQQPCTFLLCGGENADMHQLFRDTHGENCTFIPLYG